MLIEVRWYFHKVVLYYFILERFLAHCLHLNSININSTEQLVSYIVGQESTAWWDILSDDGVVEVAEEVNTTALNSDTVLIEETDSNVTFINKDSNDFWCFLLHLKDFSVTKYYIVKRLFHSS